MRKRAYGTSAEMLRLQAFQVFGYSLSELTARPSGLNVGTLEVVPEHMEIPFATCLWQKRSVCESCAIACSCVEAHAAPTTYAKLFPLKKNSSFFSPVTFLSTVCSSHTQG